MSIYSDILKKHAKALAMDMVLVALLPALEAAAKKSASPIDDVVLAALKQPLQDEILKLIEKIDG
jgi:hypothetical protein